MSVDGFDWDSLGYTVRTAVRFLDDVIEVNQFPMQKLREVNLATRRIGLGVMGWADALIRMGVPYDSKRALELTEELASSYTTPHGTSRRGSPLSAGRSRSTRPLRSDARHAAGSQLQRYHNRAHRHD